MRKKCFKCLKRKPRTAFYKHKMMADGLLGKCKECTKADALQHRDRNLEAVQEYDRQRGQLEHRKAENRQRYADATKTKTGRKRLLGYSRAWQKRNRLKRAAHVITGNAIRDGLLVKQPCARCGKKKVHAHHEDHHRPLEVTWLCLKHHGERHREMNETKRTSQTSQTSQPASGPTETAR